jgi:tetratricopeptide (TPR) repeat protein
VYETLMTIADVAGRMGDDDDAIDAFKKVIFSCESNEGGKESASFAAAVAGLGRKYYQQGKYAESLEQIEVSLSTLEASVGPNTLEYISVTGHKAVVYEQMGDRNGSLETYRRYAALAGARDAAKDKQDDVKTHCKKITDLVFLLSEMDQFDEAEATMQQILAMETAGFGAESHEVAASRRLLANLLADKGDKEGALDQFGKAQIIFGNIAKGSADYKRVVAEVSGE